METLTALTPQRGSFPEQRYTGDPVAYVDGHYIGHDGFVVPKDFPEFYERFPMHIRQWVIRRSDKGSSKEDIDDWIQDLCAHMSCLPGTSKYRKVGKRDVIQTFDPFRHFGANLPRFLNYVNHCLANRFRTIHLIKMKNPISYAESLLPFETGNVDGDPERTFPQGLKAIDVRKQTENKLLIAEFVDFVRVENPSLLPLLKAIAATGTQREVALTLGIPVTHVAKLLRQVRELGRSFISRSKTQDGTRLGTFSDEHHCRLPQLSGSSSDNYWNRVDLYNEVWIQPLVKLSRKYGVSDVRLGKVCRELKIPHPGRGYWAKRAVGQLVEQASLPEFNEAPPVRRLRRIRSCGL